MLVEEGERRCPGKPNGGGSHEEYGVAVRAAIVHGWLTMHPSGADLSFTQAEAELSA